MIRSINDDGGSDYMTIKIIKYKMTICLICKVCGTVLGYTQWTVFGTWCRVPVTGGL